MTGVRTNNISNRTAIADEFVVNRSGSTSLQSFDAVATQLAGAGPLASAIEAASGKWITVRLRADLLANLAPTNGTEGRVYGDTEVNNGVYLKEGAAGVGTWNKIAPLPEADLTTVQADLTQVKADVKNVLGTPMLDVRYVGGLMAEDGRTLLMAYTREGIVDVNSSWPLLDTEFYIADVFPDGSVYRGMRHDGTWFPDAAVTGAVEGNAWISENEVLVLKDGRRRPITFDTPPGTWNVNPTIAGDFVTYYFDDGETLTMHREEVAAATAMDLTSIASLKMVVGYGQSNSLYGSGGVIHSNPVRPGRAQMFNAGIRPVGSGQADKRFPAENVYSLVDLHETTVEGPGCGLAYGLTAGDGIPDDQALLVSYHGRGGWRYDQLKEGSIPFDNLLEGVRRGRVIASLNGLGAQFAVLSMFYSQGEANRAQTKAARKAEMLELHDRLNARVKLITGQTEDIVIVIDQISNWTAYADPALANSYSQVPVADLELALEYPERFSCPGPNYQHPFGSDGLHFVAASNARRGSYQARTYKRWVSPGLDDRPLYCTGITKVSATVYRLHMHVPVLPMVIDTVAVSNPGNYGIAWRQTGGTARDIVSVVIDGADLVVTLSGDPGAITAAEFWLALAAPNGALAGPTTGPRSNIRDSAADLDIDGVAMPNFMSHQPVTVPL